MKLGTAPIYLARLAQKCIALKSMDARLLTLLKALIVAVWLRQILIEWIIFQSKTAEYRDNAWSTEWAQTTPEKHHKWQKT